MTGEELARRPGFLSPSSPNVKTEYPGSEQGPLSGIKTLTLQGGKSRRPRVYKGSLLHRFQQMDLDDADARHNSQHSAQ